MRKSFLLIVIVVLPKLLSAQEEKYLNIGSSDAKGDDAIPLTPIELEEPPPGEIQRVYLRELRRAHSELSVLLSSVPLDGGGRESPWFARLGSIRDGFERLISTRRQEDCFLQIRPIAELLIGKNAEDFPSFASKGSDWVQSVCPGILHAIARHITEKDASVVPSTITTFVTVFSTSGFIAEGDWEDEPIPVDSAGVMILDSALVVTHLKGLPWQKAERFIGGATAEVAFARYETGGHGLAPLKAKYAAKKAEIVARWNELAAWMAQQRDGR